MMNRLHNVTRIISCLFLWLGVINSATAQTNTNSTQIQNGTNPKRPQNTTNQYQQIQIQNNDNSLNSSESYYSKNEFSFHLGKNYLDSANFYSEKNPLKATDFISKAIAYSIKENDKATESAAYLILGNIQQGLQQHESAIENYSKCINLASIVKGSSKTGNTVKGLVQETLFRANKQMAVSYIELSDFDKAEQRIAYALGYVSASVPELLSAKRVYANIKLKQGKVQESLTILNEVLAQEKQIANTTGEAETLFAIGDIYQDQKNDDKAVENYTAAKTIADEHQHLAQSLKANDLLAKIFRKQKNLPKELEVRNSNLSLNFNSNNIQGVSKENIAIGNAYLSANQMAVAQTYFDKGLNTDAVQSVYTQQQSITSNVKVLFPISNDLDEMANTYKLLAEEYLKQKNPVKALTYFEKYAELQDSIKHVRQRELNEALNISTSVGKNQQRIDLLEKERQLSEKSLEILKRDQDFKEEQLGLKNIIIGVLVFFLLSMLMAGFFVIRSSREKRKVNQMLALKSLRGQMNPHFIFNALNSVNHYISQNDERKANRYLSDFSKLMRMVMDSSKHSLVSFSEEQEMLKLYLQLEHTRFHDKFDYTFDIDESVSDADLELPPMLVQPYIENAIWHGLRYLDYKGKLLLHFEKKAHELVVTIVDNGIGRTRSQELKTHNQKKQASIGMQNIENRIGIMNDLFGTNIRVEVSDAYPGNDHCGTKVTLYIPQQH